MDEVSIAALESETAGEILEALHDVHNGSINRVDIHGGLGRLPLLNVTRVIDKALGFRERFHLLRPFPQLNDLISSAAFRVRWIYVSLSLLDSLIVLRA